MREPGLFYTIAHLVLPPDGNLVYYMHFEIITR